MIGEERESIRRFSELSQRAYNRGIYTETSFLTQGEQYLLSMEKMPLRPHFFGGFEDAERRIAVFGEEEDLGYPWESTIRILRISPKSQKYSAELSHRDFLGAILNLGIKRELVGDILVCENVGYVFILEHISDYIIQNLEKVHHTAVRSEEIPALPEGVSVQTEERCIIAASPRVDAVLSAVFDLSRSEGKELVEKERVTVSGRLITNPSKELEEGERVSVRGKGRFIFLGVSGETRSGRGRMKVKVYI